MSEKKVRRNSVSHKSDIKSQIIAFFNEGGNTPYNYKQVSAGLGLEGKSDRVLVNVLLGELCMEGVLKVTTPGKYKIVARNSVMTGSFVRRSNGKNSVVLDSGDGETLSVAERNSKHALNGDRVKVHISATRPGIEPECEVLEILERKEQTFIGTLQVDDYYAHLLTDSKFLATDIFIPLDKLKGGRTGDKAVVEIIDWPENANSPVGEVIDVLGAAGENDAEIHAILAEFGLPYRYPESVERAANRIDAGITPEEIARRRDMRDVTTFTIDPRDAKDFDDALSLEKLPGGLWRVGVHIADVTHYVTPGSAIDREAEARATSVYLVDRTIPMLPERLCNGICSLRPNEEKLAFSCIVDLDDQANVKNVEICRTVIESNRRFTYEEAQQVIETGQGEFVDEILVLDRLAKCLREQRKAEGALEFDRCEVRFDIDETGKPIDVFFKESKDANKLIEEFMLLANKKVAERIGKVSDKQKAKPFVYRIHDEPDSDKLGNLAQIASRFGYKLKTVGAHREVNRSMNQMLLGSKGKGEENMLATIAMRAMAKAVYSTVNVGHYGLAFDYYTHFTSPIRRYPDMMVHRLLAHYLDGGRAVNAEKLEEKCKHSSDMEQLAANAERASIKYKQVEYLGERLGQVYKGKVSGVTEWGLYVELDDNMCEGLVPIRDLEDDYYELDEKNFRLIGRRTNRTYQLGDAVTVQIARADLVKKQLDFALIDSLHPVGTHHIDAAPITLTRQKLVEAQEKVQHRREKRDELRQRRQKRDERRAGKKTAKAPRTKKKQKQNKNKGKHW